MPLCLHLFHGPSVSALISVFLFSWLARTDPKDVARVESKTVIVTKNQRDTIPIPAGGAKSQLGSWMCEADWQRAREERFPGCMAGRLFEGNLMFVPRCCEMSVLSFETFEMRYLVRKSC